MESARANNAQVLAARAEWEAAKARIPQARSLPDPSVLAEVMGRNVTGAERTLTLTQSFPWPGTLGSRESAASYRARAMWHQAQSAELGVIAEVRAAAFEAAFLRAQTSLIRQTLALFEKQSSYQEELSRTGGDLSELLDLDMETSTLANDLTQIEEALVRQSAKLNELTGTEIPPATLAALQLPKNTPDSPVAATLTDQLVRTNPLLQAMSARSEAAQAGIEVARLETYPEFMVSAGYNRETTMDGRGETMHEAVVMFGMSLPIWTDKNRGTRDEASAIAEAAAQEYEAAVRAAKSRLAILLSQQRDANRRASLYQTELLPKARQLNEATESSYTSGTAPLNELLGARRKLLEIEIQHARALTDAHSRAAEIDALFGTEIQPPK